MIDEVFKTNVIPLRTSIVKCLRCGDVWTVPYPPTLESMTCEQCKDLPFEGEIPDERLI